MNLKRIFLTAVALSLVVASILPSGPPPQTSKGILAGIVRDKTGAVIPGAKVTLTSAGPPVRARAAVADEARGPNRHRCGQLRSLHGQRTGRRLLKRQEHARHHNVVPSIVTTYDPVPHRKAKYRRPLP